MTQQNAAMVEETTAISHTLAEGAVELTSLVNRFQLNRRSVSREGMTSSALANHAASPPELSDVGNAKRPAVRKDSRAFHWIRPIRT